MPDILDVCCGPRMMWFDKSDDRAIFHDKRNVDYDIKPNSAYPNGTVLKINPDIVGDFANLDFDDESFYLVVFDPPHIPQDSEGGLLIKQYGKLDGDWREMLRSGFSECFRVLKQRGTLIFKWNECSVPVKEIIALTDEKPLFGHRSGKAMKTHWIVFFKEA